MILELHTWGPAFSLPSIDPQCLAAIAYLSQTVPRAQWVLVASSDAAQSPTRELPTLRDGEFEIGGFPNIVDYLREKSHGEWDLNHSFESSRDRADITAFSSHLSTNANPLIDLSLYVSSGNYTTTTRPSYSSILPWPTQFFIPPHHRSLAKIRTEYLGLSSLDLDNVDNEERHRRNLADIIPAALRTSTPTVTALVKRTQSKARFRLDGLVDACCEPLERLLDGKKYILSDERPSSLDCEVLGYLALALIPDVPQKWLGEGIRDRYPTLCTYVERGIQDCFGGKVAVEDALLSTEIAESTLASSREGNANKLPWQTPSHLGLQAAGPIILHSALDALPFYRNTIVPSPSNNKSNPHTAAPMSSSSPLVPTLIAASTAIAAVAGYILYSTQSAEPERRRLQDMGEAGAMFAGMNFGGLDEDTRVGERKRVSERLSETGQMEGTAPVGLEVDVAVDAGEKGL